MFIETRVFRNGSLVFRENFHMLHGNQSDKLSMKNTIFTRLTCYCDDISRIVMSL